MCRALNLIVILSWFGFLYVLGVDVSIDRLHPSNKSIRDNYFKYITGVNAQTRLLVPKLKNVDGNIEKINKKIQSKKLNAKFRVPEISKPVEEVLYAPKEDPRLFYQSGPYIKHMRKQNQLKNEVSEIFPGNDVIYAGNVFYHNSNMISVNDQMQNLRKSAKVDMWGEPLCLKCPADTTIIAPEESDRVVFKLPELLTCAGSIAPAGVTFAVMYGPTLGTRVKEGSYRIVGHIMYENKVVDYCALSVHVITKKCHVPKYLDAKCDHAKKMCVFSCQEPTQFLFGPRSMECINFRWNGRLPRCKVQKRCEYPNPPQNGRLACKVIQNSTTLWEGTRCRVRCRRGWRPSMRSVTLCRRGEWTHNLTCVPINS